MLFVGGVEHGLQNVDEPAGIFHAFRSAAAGAVDKGRVVNIGWTLANGPAGDFVLPVVSEVTEVVEAVDAVCR